MTTKARARTREELVWILRLMWLPPFFLTPMQFFVLRRQPTRPSKRRTSNIMHVELWKSRSNLQKRMRTLHMLNCWVLISHSSQFFVISRFLVFWFYLKHVTCKVGFPLWAVYYQLSMIHPWDGFPISGNTFFVIWKLKLPFGIGFPTPEDEKCNILDCMI